MLQRSDVAALRRIRVATARRSDALQRRSYLDDAHAPCSRRHDDLRNHYLFDCACAPTPPAGEYPVSTPQAQPGPKNAEYPVSTLQARPGPEYASTTDPMRP